MTWDQWVILIFGPSAVALSYCQKSRLRMLGPVLGLAGQAAWFYTLFVHAQWGAFIAGFAYTTSWMYGAWSLRSNYKCLFKNWIDRLTSWLRSEDSTTKNSEYPVMFYVPYSVYSNVPMNFNFGFVKSTWRAITRFVSRLRNGF